MNRTCFFAGDASFDQAQLLNDRVAGISTDKKLARDTYRRIKEYAEERPLIYVPSHDPESGNRLIDRTAVY